MSGGVDSSVTAALLKERGFSAEGGPASGWDVRGVHIKMWSDPDIPCNFKEDRYDAMRVAAKLDIPFETWDFTKEYKQAVVEYMIREYAAGRTPNPDMMCNRKVKFGVFLKKALEMGADFVATGHYVRAVPSPRPLPLTKGTPAIQVRGTKGGARPRANKDTIKLLKGRDENKDQSYFLWTLTQEQLKHCLFPIGEYLKPEVRKLARKFGLPTAEKPDSQGICFMGEIDIRDFLKKYIPVERGKVLTTSGKIIGEHDGLSFYTMGERHGLGIGGGIPYYVAGKDSYTNTLLVAEGPYDKKLFSSELAVEDINWISGKEPKLPLQCEARIRYRQTLQRCRVEARTNADLPIARTYAEVDSASVRDENKSASVRVIFDEGQRAVTPGQSVVFYKAGEMLGGGIIAF